MSDATPKKKRGPYRVKGLTADIVAYRKRYYLRRKKKKLCTQCGEPKGSAKGVFCESCKAFVNTRSKQSHARNRAERKNTTNTSNP